MGIYTRNKDFFKAVGAGLLVFTIGALILLALYSNQINNL